MNRAMWQRVIGVREGHSEEVTLSQLCKGLEEEPSGGGGRDCIGFLSLKNSKEAKQAQRGTVQPSEDGLQGDRQDVAHEVGEIGA